MFWVKLENGAKVLTNDVGVLKVKTGASGLLIDIIKQISSFKTLNFEIEMVYFFN